MGDRPIGEGFLDLVAIRATDQRPPALRPDEQQDSRVGSGNGGDPTAHRLALRIIEVVERPRVQHQADAAINVGPFERRHIALNEPHLDPGLERSIPPAPERFVDDVDSGDLPAALC